VGAVAAWYKYGDRTELADKSLKGTKDALDDLRAYLGRALAEAVKPTIQRIVQSNLQLDGTLNIAPDAILEEIRGDNFQDDVSSFVTSEMDEMLSYRTLLDARKRWSSWAKRISWGIYSILVVESLFTACFALANRVFGHSVSLGVTIVSLSVSVFGFGFCILCWGVMLRCHDKITAYRDKVL
jgi:hypothetical protein